MPVIQRLAAGSARGFGFGVGGVTYSSVISEVASGTDSINSTQNSTYQTTIAEIAFGADAIDASATRAVFAGGVDTSLTVVSTIDYIQIATTGNATSFGSLSSARYTLGPASSSTRGVFAGGLNSSLTPLSSILYLTIATTGNTSNFGTLTTGGVYVMSGCSNQTTGVFCGGSTGTSTNISTTQSITIASTGNSSLFGNVTTSKTGMAGCQSTTIALNAGGEISSSAYTTAIDQFTFASGGTATSFGSLAQSSQLTLAMACSSSTRGVFAGGRTGFSPSITNISTIQYVTISSAGNSLFFGDLTLTASFGAGTSSPTRGVIAIGVGPGYITNATNYITIATTGNGTFFGNLTVARQGVSAVSNGHGGL